MASKIKFDNSDLIPNENNQVDDMMSILDKAREDVKAEGSIAPSDEKSLPIKEEKKASKTTTSKKKSLSAREVMTQKKDAQKSKPIISDREEVITDMKVQINELLPGMTIDLNNIEISNSLNTMEEHTNLELVFHSKPTFEVALTQSAFTVFMEALLFDDIETIQNSTSDEYHATLKLYQIVHKRTQATTIGAINFDTFCECISYFDLKNLFYGLHMQTYPGTTKFDFKCYKCEHEFSSDIPNDSLIYSRDEKIFERLDEVRLNSHTPAEVLKNSLLSQTKRVCLNESKTIFDIRVPSLKDHLELLKSVPEDKYEEMANDLSTLLFIKGILVLNVPETLHKQKPVYTEVKGNVAMIKVIKNLGVADTEQLLKEITDYTDKYKTEYRIPSFKCPSCQTELGDMTVDMENVLFKRMLNL